MKTIRLPKMLLERKTKERILLIAVLLLAALLRLVGLGQLPDGVLPDEAYGAYNAWALMTEGIDSRGYAFPVYFVAWGSGMSVLYSYLAIPLMKLFGTGIAVYRLPQALVGIASVYAAYVLGRELINEKFGLFFAFVLAINPWHIMNTRFGLDANMAPGMLMIGLCFLVLGMKRKPGYLILSAIFLGATLFCYALSWIVVPLLLVFGVFLFWKRIPRSVYTVLFSVILFLLALPLLLFVAINIDWLSEIRTAFFSIPKLPGFRGEELNVGNFLASLKDILRIVLTQYDGIAYTSSEVTGAYYFFTTPFMIVGIIFHIISLIKQYKNGDNELEYVFLLWLFCAGIMAVINQNITTIHINLIHIPLIFYGAYGIYITGCYLKSIKLMPICSLFFLLSLGIFFYDYATNPTTYFFDERTDEAIEVAKSLAEEKTENGIVTIVGYATIKYSNLLWHEKPSPGDYADNVVYTGDPAWAEMESYAGFRYAGSPQEEVSSVCIISRSYLEEMADRGYEILPVNDRYYVAVSGDASQ